MEMERINDDVIKVLINIQDLKDRGVDILDLIGDQRNIEQFFYSILEEVDTEQHFRNSETLTFQVIPNREGLELYISRNSFDNLASFLEKKLPRVFGKEIRDLKLENTLPWDDGMLPDDDDDIRQEPTEVVAFRQLNDFLAAAKAMPYIGIQSTLYHFKDCYFIVLGEVYSEISDKEAYGYYAALLEYGFATKMTEAVLREYADVIRYDDAIPFFAELEI